MYWMDSCKIFNHNLFFFIGELELPFITLLLVIVAPYQVMKLRLGKEYLLWILSAVLHFEANK